MKSTELLNNILAMLRSVKEDRTKLLTLYEFMVSEIYEEVKEEQPDIPEKYRNVIREAAEWVDAGMVCYINPTTLELVCIPTHVLAEIEWEEEDDDEDDLDDYAPFREDLRRVNTEWDKFVTVEPLTLTRHSGLWSDLRMPSPMSGCIRF